MRCDVSSEADFHNLVEGTRRELEGPHIAVNDAGKTHRKEPALDVTEEEFDGVYRVNLKSLFWSTQAESVGRHVTVVLVLKRAAYSRLSMLLRIATCATVSRALSTTFC